MKLRVYNKTLDPNIWNEDKTIKPEVRESLLKIAEDFYNSTDITSDIQNILFLGSSANYNWTPSSDIDLHIVIDIAGEKIAEEYARKFMDGVAFKWNTEHDIEVKGHPVELYLQDVREPNSTPQQARPGAAIYSIYDDKWLLEPNPQNIQLDSDKIRKKYQTLKKKIKTLVETEDIEQLKTLMKSIRNYRNAGLAEGGEFSVENLVFKALRHSGDLGNIKDTINKVYDKKASLPEQGNVLPHKKTQPLKEALIARNADLYLGFIKRNNFKVIGIDVHDDSLTHARWQETLPPELQWYYGTEALLWRYKRKTNTVYWWSMFPEPNEDEKQYVEDWLFKHVNIKYPKHQMISWARDPESLDQRIISHTADNSDEYRYGIEESDESKYLLVGMVNKELDVICEKDLVGYGNVTHESLIKKRPEYDFKSESTVFWRYKKVNNMLYWQAEPSEQQRFVVLDYLNKHYKITIPHQKLSHLGYDADALKIDEGVDSHLYDKLVGWIFS